MRGLQRDNINVLIDGGRIYGACPNRMDSPAFHVDFSEIDHVEVTKGPYDIENQGSLGGVVNIITRKPETGLHGSAVLAAGSNGFVNPSVNASWGGPNFSALAGYSHRTADPYRDGNGQIFTEVSNYAPGQADTAAFRVNTAWAKLYAKPSANQTLDAVVYPPGSRPRPLPDAADGRRLGQHGPARARMAEDGRFLDRSPGSASAPTARASATG